MICLFICCNCCFRFILSLNLLLRSQIWHLCISGNASAGRMTYVHCKAGRGRSTTIVLCYLVMLLILIKLIVSHNFWLIRWTCKFGSLTIFYALILIHSQVKYKNMTPAAALEYVRSRRPRVLLAPSQWRVCNTDFLVSS